MGVFDVAALERIKMLLYKFRHFSMQSPPRCLIHGTYEMNHTGTVKKQPDYGIRLRSVPRFVVLFAIAEDDIRHSQKKIFYRQYAHLHNW